MRVDPTSGFKDRGITLIWTIQQLPALTVLDIRSILDDLPRSCIDGNGDELPWCSDLAALQSRSLTRLHVDMLGGPSEGSMLRLTGLPELRSLSLAAYRVKPLNAWIDSASFQGNPHLNSLHILWDAELQLQPGSLAHLSALTSLKLVGCGLWEMPAYIALLGANLCELDLSSNSIHIDAAAVASLPPCSSSVRKLVLDKVDNDHWKVELDPDAWLYLAKHIHIKQEG